MALDTLMRLFWCGRSPDSHSKKVAAMAKEALVLLPFFVVRGFVATRFISTVNACNAGANDSSRTYVCSSRTPLTVAARFRHSRYDTIADRVRLEDPHLMLRQDQKGSCLFPAIHQAARTFGRVIRNYTIEHLMLDSYTQAIVLPRKDFAKSATTDFI